MAARIGWIALVMMALGAGAYGLSSSLATAQDRSDSKKKEDAQQERDGDAATERAEKAGKSGKPDEKRAKPKGNAAPDGKSKNSGAAKAEEEEDRDSFELQPGSRRQTDAYWKKKTPGLAYKVMRQHATEVKFSGKYTRSKAKGIYRCAACEAVLFSSDQKFDSGTGWPAFWAPLAPMNIGRSVDTTLPGQPRIEVHCIACGGHLGHVFQDGPPPTGLRYCINSVSLKLDESEEAKKLMKEGAKGSEKRESGSSKQQ
jgi:peptide-methionine (R)-S-oxide reductase